jgi:hypothetical protein
VNTLQSGVSDSTSLFRPRPVTELQNNLAQFYERTSRFVNDQFSDMMENKSPEMKKTKSQNLPADTEGPRLNPKGMGTIVDILV